MSMTETPIAPAKPTPRKPRRARTRAKRPAVVAAPPPKPPSELEGLTVSDCATGCTAERCVISGINVCMHPCKGGLHAAFQTQADALRRFNAAKLFIGEQKLHFRGI